MDPHPSDPPSQPPKSASYTTTPDNPVTCTPAEKQHHHHHHGDNKQTTEDRLPPSSGDRLNISDATPSSLGYGIRGGERAGLGGRNGQGEPDDEKMRPPAEGAVADAVARKPGAGAAEPDMAGDLERKKREQAAALEAVKERRRHGGVADGGDLRAGVDT